MQIDNFSTTGVKEVLNNIKKTFKGMPPSIEEIRQSLMSEHKTEEDFVKILEKHHGYLEESIVVLKEAEASSAEKQEHLSRLIQVLTMHAKAEQETLYQSLIHATDRAARLEGLAGHNEHDIAFQIARELQRMNFQISWSEEIDAKAQVLAGIIHNHIKEEEGDMFDLAETAIDEIQMRALASVYLEKCKMYVEETLPINPDLTARELL